MEHFAFPKPGGRPYPPPTGSTALPFLRRKSKESTILHFGHMRGIPESPPELKAPRGDDNWQIAYVRSVKALKRGFSQRRMGSRGQIRALETVFYSSRKGGSGRRKRRHRSRSRSREQGIQSYDHNRVKVVSNFHSRWGAGLARPGGGRRPVTAGRARRPGPSYCQPECDTAPRNSSFKLNLVSSSGPERLWNTCPTGSLRLSDPGPLRPRLARPPSQARQDQSVALRAESPSNTTAENRASSSSPLDRPSPGG